MTQPVVMSAARERRIERQIREAYAAAVADRKKRLRTKRLNNGTFYIADLRPYLNGSRAEQDEVLRLMARRDRNVIIEPEACLNVLNNHIRQGGAKIGGEICHTIIIEGEW